MAPLFEQPDASEQLRRQLLFIHSSCSGYDSGILEEALRIAVSLRVLFHQTASSHSLIEQLGTRSSLHLLSTFQEQNPKETDQGRAVSIGGTLSKSGVAPELDQSPHRRFLPFATWWSEIVHTFGSHFSRRDIILSAANQDGGAHVAPAPSPNIQELRSGVGTIRYTTKDGTFIRPLSNAHFYLLRQFGHEILNSPELTSQSGEKPLDFIFFPRKQ